MTPTAYLDTCIASGLVRGQLIEAEANAVASLLAMPASQLRLCTSQVMKDELMQSPAAYRDPDVAIYEALARVPSVPDSAQVAPMMTSQTSRLTGGPIVHDPKVREIGERLGGGQWAKNPNDARHIFQALENGVDYFVTVDVKSILVVRETFEAAYPIRLRRPSELLRELTAI